MNEIKYIKAFFAAYKGLFLWLQIVGIFAVYDVVPIWFNISSFTYQLITAFALMVIPPVGALVSYFAAIDAWNWEPVNAFIIFLGIHALAFAGFVYYYVMSKLGN